MFHVDYYIDDIYIIPRGSTPPTFGSDTGGGMYWSAFNARSILLFINGVMQAPFEQYDFDRGDKYFFFRDFGVVSSNSFLGLIKKLFKHKNTQGVFSFVFFVYEKGVIF